MIALLIGGARAGKSDHAVTLATERGGSVLFVATAEARDDEMALRIRNHRESRPTDWDTLEVPLYLAPDLARHLDARREAYSTIIVDCLTLWVSNVMLRHEDAGAEAAVVDGITGLLDVAEQHGATQWVVVTNEVGLGLVPDNALGRAYRDALGRANQMVAKKADNVSLLVAGLAMRMK